LPPPDECRARLIGPNFKARNVMDLLSGAIALLWSAIEQVLIYVETHHWIFAFLAGGYIFYLHDKSVHARFDALENRIDEIRKRLALEL
jgi:hypothetical protein